MTVTAEHSSGRFDVDPATLKAALTKQLADEPDFLSLTEMMSEARAAVLDDFPAYSVARARGTTGEDECALLVLRSRHRIVSARAVRLSDLPIPRRSGKFDHALVVVVEDVLTAARHTRVIVHRPSGVEGAERLADNAQAACYRDGTEGLKRLVASIDGPLVITGDHNLSLRRRWVRTYFAKHFPDFATSWAAATLPDLGTHGPRVIDFSLVRGFSVTAAEVVSAFGASDHRAIRETHKETTVTKGIYPAAKQLLIPPGENDPAIVPRIAVLHVDAGNAESLYTFFRDRSGGVESHFHVRKDGVVEQYRNIFRQADANLNANDFAVSIETQGLGAGEWTPLQLSAIKKLLLWLNSEAGIPLIRCTAWDGRGVGYHIQFGTPGPWTPSVKSCPGPDRIKQYNEVIIPWMKSLTAPAPRDTPRWDLIWETANAIVQDAADDADSELDDKDDVARKIRALAARYSTKH